MSERSPHIGDSVGVKFNLLKDGIAQPTIYFSPDGGQVVPDVLVCSHESSVLGGEFEVVNVGFSISQALNGRCPFLLVIGVKSVTAATLNESEVLATIHVLGTSIKCLLILEIGVHKAEVFAGEDSRSRFAIVLHGQEEKPRIINKIGIKGADLEKRGDNIRRLEVLGGKQTEIATVVRFQVIDWGVVCETQNAQQRNRRCG